MIQQQHVVIIFLVVCAALGIVLSGNVLQPAKDAASSAACNGGEDQEKAAMQKLLNEATDKMQELFDNVKDLEVQKNMTDDRLQNCQQILKRNNINEDMRRRRRQLEKENSDETSSENDEEHNDDYRSNDISETIAEHSQPTGHPFCHLLSQTLFPELAGKTRQQPMIPSTTFVWDQFVAKKQTYLQEIYHPMEMEALTAELFPLVTAKLPQSVLSSPPNTWTSLQSILDRAWKRYDYMQQHPDVAFPVGGTLQEDGDDTSIPPPIQIGVVGGTLQDRTMWIRDLEALMMTTIPKGGLVLEPMNLDSWNTSNKKVVPDILVVEFDAIVPLTKLNNNGEDERDTLFHRFDAFYRQVMEKRQEQACRLNIPMVPPLIILLDDVLALADPKTTLVRNMLDYTSRAMMLAQYYGLSMVSYSHVVQEWVYDTVSPYHSLFGIATDPKVAKQSVVAKQLVASMIVLYQLMHLMTHYCNDVETTAALETKLSPPTFLPPLLTEDLTLETMTTNWQHPQEQVNCDVFEGEAEE